MQGTLLLSGRFYLVLLTGPILVTNLLSTGLITWKAWCALLASDPRQLSLTIVAGVGNAVSQ